MSVKGWVNLKREKWVESHSKYQKIEVNMKTNKKFLSFTTDWGCWYSGSNEESS